MSGLGAIFSIAIFFLIIERLWPGRALPSVKGWFGRALILNVFQLLITLCVGWLWNNWWQGTSLGNSYVIQSAIFQGFLGWFVGTFVFYWWHRARHKINFLWRVFHQIHHSPARIETLTAFYKHPLEIFTNALIINAVLFALLGISTEGAVWYNVFAALGEFYYHSNFKTPHWTGWLIQRPEHHSIHHQLDVHDYNYGDITLWDRLFGTFKDTDTFVEYCGFPQGKEKNLGKMLLFGENYRL